MAAREQVIQAAFAKQADACQMLGSPFMARLCKLFADHIAETGAVGRKVLAWQGDVSPAGDSVPLRLAGALHALVLTGPDDALALAYPPHEVSDQALWQAVSRALERHADYVVEFIDSPPQTNEVRRSSAVMAGLLAFAARHPGPVELLELGASAGLNLFPDRYRHVMGGVEFGDHKSPLCLAPEWRGAPVPLARVDVVGRAGCDLRPTDLADPGQLLRLRSYLWADQPDRMERTMIAANLAREALGENGVEQEDAAAWLARKLASPAKAGRFVFHTIAFQYFPGNVQRECLEALERAGTGATASTPLAHFSMEADGGNGAALTLHIWPEGEAIALGRADFHGRWVEIF